MCGIVGVFDYTGRNPIPLNREQALAMVDSLVHRGPDDGGLAMWPGIMLGHRRLSILDVSQDGHQPMIDERTGCALVYNGEIYNFPELRAELIQAGHRFHSTTDTEVLLRGYIEWGQMVVHRLNGMFAFALVDPRDCSLWLVRDGIGIKPLFVHDDGKRYWFASEIKAILTALPSLARMDRQGINRFLAFGYTPSPRTGFERIEQIRPGEAWTVRLGHSITKTKWYRLPYPERASFCTLDEATDRLGCALDQSVKRQLVSDVPVGAMLSGGLDSSAIVRSMHRAGSNRMESFSAGFAESSFDERGYASLVAARYQSHHSEVTLLSDAQNGLHRLVSHAEEPLADNSALPIYFLSEFMRKSVTVALNGDGADELLAGYDTYRASQLAPYYRCIPKWIRENALRPALDLLPNSVAKYSTKMMLGRFLSFAGHEAPRDHALWRSMVDPRLRKQLFRKSFLVESDDPWSEYISVLDEAPEWLSPLERQLHMDLRFHLPNGLMVKTDRMSMAHGLEVRVPWLDQEVIAACLSFPATWKRRGRNGKRVLKQLLSSDLTRDITHRRKAGFVIPLESWMRNDWQPFLRDHLHERFAQETDLFHWPVLLKMMDDQRDGRADHAYALYTLLILAIWWETWITGRTPPCCNRPTNARAIRVVGEASNC